MTMNYDQILQGLVGQNGVIGDIAGAEAPTIAQYQQQAAQAQAQAGLIPAQEALSGTELQTSTGYQQALLGNQYQGNQLSQQGLAEQAGTAARQQQFEIGEYGNQLAGLALTGQQNQAAFGNQQQNLALQQGLLGTQEGLAGQTQQLQQGTGGVGGGGFAAQLANLEYQYPLQQQQAAGAAAAQGASGSVGARQQQATLTEQQAYNVGNVQNAAQQSALGYQGQQAQFAETGGQLALQGQENVQQYGATGTGGFAGQQLSLSQQLAGLQQGSEVAGYQGQQAQFANQGQQLGNAAAGMGISSQQLQSELRQGLSQIGITGAGAQDQLLGQADQAQAGESQGLGAILSQAGTVTGLGPQAYTSAFPNLYVGGTQNNVAQNLQPINNTGAGTLDPSQQQALAQSAAAGG